MRHQPARFSAYMLDRAERQRVLGGEAAVEGQSAAVLVHQVEHVHNFRLEGIKAVQSNANQILEELIDIPTGMDKNLFTCLMHGGIHPAQRWADKLAP